LLICRSENLRKEASSLVVIRALCVDFDGDAGCD
jgi:hypothetical protein